MVDPVSLLIAGGAIGYAIARDGKTIVPVTGQDLRESKPSFEKKIEIDTSVAHSEALKNWEYPEEGNLIYVVNPTTPTGTVYIRFNEPEAQDWDLTKLRKIRFPFYRFFITNTAGTGTLEIRVARGLQVEPFEGQVDTVLSVDINDLADVAAASPSDDNLLGYVSATGYWTSVAITAIAGFASHKARHQDGGGDEISLTGLAGDPADTINESLLTTQDDIIVRGASVAGRLAIAASRIVGKKSTGNVAALTAAEVRTLLSITNVEDTAHSTDAHTMTIDGVDVSAHAVLKAANAVLGHVIVETGSDIDVDGDGKLTLGGHKGRHEDGGTDEISIAGLAGAPAQKGAASGLASLNASTKVVEQPASITDHLEGTPTEDLATKAPTSEYAYDHNATPPLSHWLYQLLSRGHIITVPVASDADLAAGGGWTAATGGTSATATISFGLLRVGCNSDIGDATWNKGILPSLSPGDSQGVNWDKELYFQFTLMRILTAAGSNAIEGYVQLKHATTKGALANDGIGVRILGTDGLDIRGEAYGSAALGTADFDANLTSSDCIIVGIHHRPGVSVDFYVNGTLQANNITTANEVPSGQITVPGVEIVVSLETTDDPNANVRMNVGDFLIVQAF